MAKLPLLALLPLLCIAVDGAPVRDARGRALFTSIDLRVGDRVYGSPWYLGDSARDAAASVCATVANDFADVDRDACTAQLETAFLERADAMVTQVDAARERLPRQLDVSAGSGVLDVVVELLRDSTAAASTTCDGDVIPSSTAIWQAFENTDATKELHCFSWMYAELLARYHCKGSAQHVAAGGERLQMLEIGFYEGGSTELWKVRVPTAIVHVCLCMCASVCACFLSFETTWADGARC